MHDFPSLKNSNGCVWNFEDPFSQIRSHNYATIISASKLTKGPVLAFLPIKQLNYFLHLHVHRYVTKYIVQLKIDVRNIIL